MRLRQVYRTNIKLVYLILESRAVFMFVLINDCHSNNYRPQPNTFYFEPRFMLLQEKKEKKLSLG